MTHITQAYTIKKYAANNGRATIQSLVRENLFTKKSYIIDISRGNQISQDCEVHWKEEATWRRKVYLLVSHFLI